MTPGADFLKLLNHAPTATADAAIAPGALPAAAAAAQ
jgi:hypothetical protein